MPSWNHDRWTDRLIDRFDSHPVAVSVVCSLGNILAAIVLDHRWSAQAPAGRPWHQLAALVIIVALAVTLPALVTERTKTLRSRRTTIKVIQKVLTSLAQQCGYPERHVRANIMLPDPSRRTRKVDTKTAFNMDGDPDRDLEISATTGVSGHAWNRRRGQIGDLMILSQDAGPDWGLTDDEQAKIREHLSTILSVPIFDPGDSHGPLIGTLQVDSDCPNSVLAWNDATVARAQTVSDVIALHLGFKL